MRRSQSMRDALRKGLVPRSFDRLVARIANEPVFPESRKVTYACTCSEEKPCRHILALHELFARRLDQSPWELLTLRGVPLRDLLEQAERAPERRRTAASRTRREARSRFSSPKASATNSTHRSRSARSAASSARSNRPPCPVVRDTIDALVAPEPPSDGNPADAEPEAPAPQSS